MNISTAVMVLKAKAAGRVPQVSQCAEIQYNSMTPSVILLLYSSKQK